MDSQSSCVSAVSAASSVAEECGLNLEDPDLLTALEETEAEYFLDWFDQLEEPEEMETDQPNEEEEEVAGLPEATAAEFPSLSEKDAIFMQQGRCCTKRCVTRFDEQEVIENRLTFVEMDTEVRNRYILFYIQSCTQSTRTHTETVPSKGHASKERERAHTRFYFHGVEVCQKFFLFLYAISKNILCELSKFYDISPVASRLSKEHGNKKRLPSNTLSLESKQDARQFILAYANKHCIPLPGRMPTVTNFAEQQLPSDVTKAGVYREYITACQQAEKRPLSLTLFKELWPANIHVMKPESDICSTCQKNNRLIFRSPNQSDELKTQRVQHQQEHLR